MNRPAFSLWYNYKTLKLEFQQGDLNASALAFRCRQELTSFVGDPANEKALSAATGAVNWVIDNDIVHNRLYLEPYDCKWISLR